MSETRRTRIEDVARVCAAECVAAVWGRLGGRAPTREDERRFERAYRAAMDEARAREERGGR